MESYKGRFEPTRFEDLSVTVDFHCNSACQFCIVQEGMNYFRGLPFERFKQAVDDNGRAPRYRRVTFTGGEVTLEKSLLKYVEYAREHGGFDHIRLQTNARLLADRAFAEKLIHAGIDEFFVSLHGPNAEIQDRISQRPGSFDEAWQGMRHLKDLGVVLMTNTVLTTLNVDHLEEIVDVVSELFPTRMEFWNYLPMEDYADERELLAPMSRLAPALRKALTRARSLSIPCAVKYVPQCLLGEFADCIDNAQPDVVIVESFYDVYPRFSCIWEAKCEHSETCLGLTHPYISKFGWEQELLTPVPRTRPWEEPDEGLALPSDTPGGTPRDTTRHHESWLALIGDAPQQAGATLDNLQLDRRRCIFQLATPSGSRVDLVLTRRNDEAPALARSQSFNISYRKLETASDTDERAERALLSQAIRNSVMAIVGADTGELMLDERKGLVGADAFRRRREAKGQ